MKNNTSLLEIAKKIVEAKERIQKDKKLIENFQQIRETERKLKIEELSECKDPLFISLLNAYHVEGYLNRKNELIERYESIQKEWVRLQEFKGIDAVVHIAVRDGAGEYEGPCRIDQKYEGKVIDFVVDNIKNCLRGPRLIFQRKIDNSKNEYFLAHTLMSSAPYVHSDEDTWIESSDNQILFPSKMFLHDIYSINSTRE